MKTQTTLLKMEGKQKQATIEIINKHRVSHGERQYKIIRG